LDDGITRFWHVSRAEMKFYNETTELPNGSYIKLGSVVNVIIQLTNNIEGTNFTDTLNVHVVSNVNVIIQ